MNVPFLDLKRQSQHLEQEILPAIAEVLEKGWFIGGEKVITFERNFASYIGAANCIGCGSGTDALELILRAYGIGPGDEVLVPSFTWISDAEAVSVVGAKPVFVDVLPHELTIDPVKVEEAITPRTKAVIGVHLYGLPCRMDELLAIGKTYGLKIIEDCAQAHGAEYKGQKVGSIGDAAAFSFYPTKNLGAYGDAGAVTTDDPVVADKVRLLSNHGQPQRGVHVLEGRNSRLDVVQATVLDIKLKYLEQWNERRREIAKVYSEGLKTTEFSIPVEPANCKHVYHLYVIQTKNRNAIQDFLTDKDIVTAIHYPKALHQLDCYSHFHLNDEDFPVASEAAATVLSLPVFPELSQEEVEWVVKQIATGKH